MDVIGKNEIAPICLFTYNRLDETKQTIEALKANFLAKESVLYIFSDGWKNENTKSAILAVREYLDTITGFKEIYIIKSDINKGLAKSIITGVSQILSKYENVIVLEDDLITSPNFLDFMNQALVYYKEDFTIQTISGYTPLVKSKEDNFKFNRPFPWGWATWKVYWYNEIFDKERVKKYIQNNSNLIEKFGKVMGEDAPGMLLGTLTNKNDSWYILWTLDHFINNRQCLYSNKSKVTNVGYNEEGTHCNFINTYIDNFKIDNTLEFNFRKELKTNNSVLKYFSKSYKFIFRLKLIFKSNGIKALKKELLFKIYGK